MTRSEIYRQIDAERIRQHEKWGGRHNWGVGDCSSLGVLPQVKAMVLNEECGEVNRAILDDSAFDLQRELIQVASVAVAWLESMS
jgi:hypothetical protein